MKKLNVSSKRTPGRTTQYMSENFSDLADLANQKLLDSSVTLEKKLHALNEMISCLELAVEKSQTIPVSSKLRKIIAKIEILSEELVEFRDTVK
jgi:hypothetical protein